MDETFHFQFPQKSPPLSNSRPPGNFQNSNPDPPGNLFELIPGGCPGGCTQLELTETLHKTSQSCPPQQEFKHALDPCIRPVRSPRPQSCRKKGKNKAQYPRSSNNYQSDRPNWDYSSKLGK